MLIRSKQILTGIHILVWLILLTVPYFIFRNQPFYTGLPEYYFLFSNLFHIGLFYLNAFFLYPRLLNRRLWWAYIICIAALVHLSYYIKLMAVRFADPAFTSDDLSERLIFFPTIPFLFAGFLYRFVANRIRDERKEKEKKAELLASQIRFLRSQVSPHFLFNTLTNMVSLARQKSDILEPSLIRLSELLRYMLYDTGERFSIDSEISALENYIGLQKLRFGENAIITLEIDVDDRSCQLEPMLLIPFVENAFKHGIGLAAEPFIFISIKLREGNLDFIVRNNYSAARQSKDANSGIGLANVKHRLQLLYTNRHNLTIKDDGSTFDIQLKIDLQCSAV